MSAGLPSRRDQKLIELLPNPVEAGSGIIHGVRLIRRAWLGLRVHADAYRQAPLAYLQAMGWRLCGLKVRSRNRIAPLAGRSPRAYALWIARQQPFAPRTGNGLQDHPGIIPVVDCRSGIGIEETLASIGHESRAIEPILIGGAPYPNCRQVDQPHQLASILPGRGAWICPMKAGDLLGASALDAYAAAIEAAPQSGIIYADDDLIGDDRIRCRPHFKPQWNPDLFTNHDYVTGAFVAFAEPANMEGLPNSDWERELLDRLLHLGKMPVHLPSLLHHRKSRPEPSVPAVPSDPLQSPPTVSAIIPTRNQVGLLSKCVEGVQQANYPNIELLIVDNGSDDPAALSYLSELEGQDIRVLRRPGPFNFSVLNNEAVRHVSGSVLCFLNNDVEMVDRAWLSLIVRQAIRPEIGAVGAMLLYPDRTIQHAGVYLGIGGGAGHGHRFLSENESGYFNRARLPQQVSAVTAACMVVEREKFLAVGGFDETLFPVAFNDVDLCLKLNGRGWQSFYEPRAKLIHHESKSRGSDSAKGNRTRFAGELAALKAKWGTDRNCDPFHHPQLSPFSEQFVIAV